MASVLLLAAFLLCSSFPVGAQDTRTYCPGSCLREYADKGCCTYTYVVPPGSRTGGCSPPVQFVETKEETGSMKNQVDRLLSLVEIFLSQQSNLTQELQDQKISHQAQIDSLANLLSEERARSAQLEQNLTRELQENETREPQEQEARLQAQVQNLSDQLSEERARSAQLEQNLTQALLLQEAKVTGLLDGFSAQLSEERDKNRELALNLTQALIQLDNMTSTKYPTQPVPTASDCAQLYAAGQTTSGVYNIRLGSSNVETYCDMDTAGGGWTVIQRRQDGSVPFDRTWEEYKPGFGNKNGEYWLGNENIHLLTSQKAYTLRVDMLDWEGETAYATYDIFRVSGESDQYRLRISGYSGTAGDAMAHNDGQMFSTVDRDNDTWSSLHCSQRYGQGGWWFGGCSASFLNGRYLRNCGNSCPAWQGVVWWRWRGRHYSLKSVSMKIRP
ncbi:angiopoietin-2-like [Branchiostoma floridae x Branchiostoma belcheri]